MDGLTEAEIVSRPADSETSIAESAESMLLPKTLPLDGRWPVISINASDALKPIELKLEVSGDSVDDHTRGNDDTSTKAEGILAHSDVKLEPSEPEVSIDIGRDSSQPVPGSNALTADSDITLKKHADTEGSSEPFSCNICNYQCSNIYTLVNHMKIHTGDKPYDCDYCKLKFSQLSQLKAHAKTHIGGKPLSCKYSDCDYRCVKPSDLITHEMKDHTVEKPFSCEHCFYKTSNKSHLKAHAVIHTGEKPFACSQCDSKFSRNRDLKTHMVVHTREKPFACEHCDYKGSRPNHLKIHMRAHLGVKPYSCPFCDFRCSQNSSLKTHIRSHTGEKPFMCNVCDYKAVTRGQLLAHNMTRRHRKIQAKCEDFT